MWPVLVDMICVKQECILQTEVKQQIYPVMSRKMVHVIGIHGSARPAIFNVCFIFAV